MQIFLPIKEPYLGQFPKPQSILFCFLLYEVIRSFRKSQPIQVASPLPWPVRSKQSRPTVTSPALSRRRPLKFFWRSQPLTSPSSSNITLLKRQFYRHTGSLQRASSYLGLESELLLLKAHENPVGGCYDYLHCLNPAFPSVSSHHAESSRFSTRSILRAS